MKTSCCRELCLHRMDYRAFHLQCVAVAVERVLLSIPGNIESERQLTNQHAHILTLADTAFRRVADAWSPIAGM